MHKEKPPRNAREQGRWRARWRMRSRWRGALHDLPGFWPLRRTGVLIPGSTMILFQDRKLLFQGWRPAPLPAMPALTQRLARRARGSAAALWRMAAAALVIALGALASESARHWLGVALTNFCIVGGVVAAPIVSLLAWIGMTLPTRAPLHAASPVLFTTALIWLLLAIIGAHTQSGDHDT